MHSSFLATRIRIPPQRHQLVHRARLCEAIEAGIPASRLVLVSAPAGYGKTTLVAQWARASRFRVAWLSLAGDDNDVEPFLRHLVSAWDAVHPGITETPVGLLLGATSPDVDAVLTAFVAVATESDEHTVFVLDDGHRVESEPVYRALATLIEHLPPTLHVVVADRGEPPLPLARYRARGELLEFGSDGLCFREEETRAFLELELPDGLAADAVAALQEQLHGWAAGLRLVCHAVRRRPEAARPLRIGGRHRFIADYLDEEVLTGLDPDTRRFLLRTSLLEGLSGELCDATVEGRDSQRMLETLERDGLFLTALDDTREWFRFHPLFADVLREKLRQEHPEEVARLHSRAARWFLDHAMPDQAFGHAVAGGDVDLVTRIGEDYCVIKLESGELNVVARWLRMIPEPWFAAYPLVDLLRVAYLIYTGAFEECVRCLASVEARLRRSPGRDARHHLAKVATVRCAIACFHNDLPSAEAHAAAALSDLPPDDGFYRASIYHALGETYARNACWDQAREALLHSLRIVHAPSWRIRSVHIYGALADLELRQGHLEAAGGYWSSALEAIRERELWGRLPIPVTGWVFIRMGELLYERNRLDEARAHLARGLELAELGGDVRALIAGYLLSARLSLTEGLFDQVEHHLDLAHPLLERTAFPDWSSRRERLQLELWLARDRRRAVARWADAQSPDGMGQPTDEPDIAQLTLARAWIAKGHPLDRKRAIGHLGHLIEAAAAHGREDLRIEALALRALASWADGDRAGALTALEHALRIAEPEGYVRLFADLGLPMARLLQEAQDRKVLPEYVRKLLEAFSSGVGPDGRVSPPLPEPLSARELEVLRLLAAGLTNREIGEALFISAETVKKHTASIYAKLHVSHRTEAVARSRELGILDDAR